MREHRGHGGLALRQAREVVNRDISFALAREVRDYGERAEVGERVRGQVEHRRGGARLRNAP